MHLQLCQHFCLRQCLMTTDVVHFGVLPSHFDYHMLAVDCRTTPPLFLLSGLCEKAVTYFAPTTSCTGGLAMLAFALSISLLRHDG